MGRRYDWGMVITPPRKAGFLRSNRPLRTQQLRNLILQQQSKALQGFHFILLRRVSGVIDQAVQSAVTLLQLLKHLFHIASP